MQTNHHTDSDMHAGLLPSRLEACHLPHEEGFSECQLLSETTYYGNTRECAAKFPFIYSKSKRRCL